MAQRITDRPQETSPSLNDYLYLVKNPGGHEEDSVRVTVEDLLALAGGGGGTPGGDNTQVQFNDGDAFSGDANFVFNKTDKSLNLIGTPQKTRASIGSSTISNQAVVQIKNQATDFDVFGEVLQIQGVISSTSSGSGVGIATDVTANQTDGNLFFVEGHDIQIHNSSTGDIGDIWGLGIFINNGALGGTITAAEGIHISTFTSASGSIADVIGLNIDDQAIGTNSNHAIKTGLGLVEFGDEVKLAAGTIGHAQLNIAVGVAPTAPVDGDIWYESGALKFQLGGLTKTITLS